jgi:integrase
MAKDRGEKIKPYVYGRMTPEGMKYTIRMRGIPGGEFNCPVGTTIGQADKLVQKFQGERTKDDGSIMDTLRKRKVAEGWALFKGNFETDVSLGEGSQATMDDVYEPGWRIHISTDPIARKALNDVTAADIKRVSKAVRAKTSNSTAKRIETILRSIFREARLAKWTDNDPFKDLRAGKDLAPSTAKTPPREPLTATRMQLLLSHVTEMYWDEIALLTEFPVRVSELLGVRRRDIDFTGLGPDRLDLPMQAEADDAEITPGTPAIYFRVQQKREGRGTKITKNTLAVRPLPLSAGATDILLRRLEKEEARRGELGPDDQLFTREGDNRPVPRYSIRQAIMQAAERAGLPPITTKDLRMSLSTAFSFTSTPAKVAAASGGHSEATRAKHYDRSNLVMDARVQGFEAIRANGYRISDEELIKRGVRKEES